ncbi:arsenate reductase/protein-tyrosine-phosphatase family protein [Microbacterium sp. SA39]|uniref:arsenate reductase/protein-tyrosine-phosphatase family protein n=1 Tax=Microbacterium sp. SA39 TaxID=1263625 RepID=UPI0005FA2D5D|nr:hypothetical protein [Microbacterium sp. SA39]KJQ53360.1 tyrosine phosphatase [Microbacterium sp. SA39]
MTHRLIFVCEANVCRSPLMEIVMRAQTGAGDWQISSAGTRVGRGALEICQVSASIAAEETDAASAETHRSQAVDIDDLRSADLILTASRAERSVVATLAPEVRSRAFTLREAIHLGAEPVRQPELELVAQFDSLADDERELRVYADALHTRRGFVTLPPSRRSLFGRPGREPYDIADAHHRSDREHHAMLRVTVGDVKSFHAQVTEFLSASPSAPTAVKDDSKPKSKANAR